MLRLLNVLQPDTSPRLQASPSLLNPLREPGIVLKAIVEPIVLQLKTNQEHPPAFRRV
jgi:hypothetical protein